MRTVMSSASDQSIQMHTQQLQMLGEAQDPDALEEQRMREACEGFEAIFIQQMWQEMRASLPQDGLMHSQEEEFWQGMYDEELAKSMAAEGGIGLADMMMQQMMPQNTTASASRATEAATGGLTVNPAPLMANSSQTITQAQSPESASSPIMANPTITMQAQAAPLMDMGIYEEVGADPVSMSQMTQGTQTAPTALVNENVVPNIESQIIDDVQAVLDEATPAEPIVTRVTYQTNLPEGQRNGDDLVQQILAQAEATNQQMYDAVLETESSEESFEEMIPTLMQPQQVAFPNPAQIVSPVNNALNNDILAGITPTYIKASEIAAMQAEQTAQQQMQQQYSQQYVQFAQPQVTQQLTSNLQRDYAATLAQQADLQPTFAGGPDMIQPQVITGTTELGYLNPTPGSLDNPVDGEITSGFGWRLDPINGRRSWHNGVDITAPVGSPVRAAEEGFVSFAGYDEEFGNMVMLQHPNGLTTLYGHNGNINVQAGDYVQRGTEIATVGSTGRALGNHLHFEIRKADMPINPETVLIQDVVAQL